MTRQARDLLEHGLKDMYDAEHRFADALTEMISNTKDPALADGFRRHREVTQQQARRLEGAFADLGTEPQRATCQAAQGLVREYQNFVKELNGNRELHDAFAAEAALKVEHYEIASYRPLVDLAEFLDLKDATRALKRNLSEEEETAVQVQSASTKLSGELAGASTADIARRAVEGMFDQAREHTLASVGTARTVGEKAIGSARKAVGRAERRGRTVVKRARTQAKSRARKAKATTTRARKTVARRKPATTRRKTTTARRKTTTARRKTAGPRRKTSTTRARAKRTSPKRSTARR